eukprot:2864340-Prymnesium_polylepis.1
MESAYPKSNLFPSIKGSTYLSLSEVLAPHGYACGMTSQLFVSGHNLAPYVFQKPRLGHMPEQTLFYICFRTVIRHHMHSTCCAATIAAAYGDEVSTASERNFPRKF